MADNKKPAPFWYGLLLFFAVALGAPLFVVGYAKYFMWLWKVM